MSIYDPSRQSPDRKVVPQILHDVLARVAARANDAERASARSDSRPRLVIFDLDSTLLDNRPRQARILREYGQSAGLPQLIACTPEHFTGWSIRVPMQSLGLDPEEAARHEPAAKQFWRQRFFTSEYCVDDRAIPGAVEFVRRIRDSGATIVYCTGRHLDMEAGTVACFQREGFPVPDARAGVHLLMKPTFEIHDDEWKRMVRDQLLAMGEVVAAFDNEPTHINTYREHFPAALCVHLLTDDSSRGIAVHPEIPSVLHFVLP